MLSNDAMGTALLSIPAGYDKSPITRKICHWGLWSTWIAGIASTVTGLSLLASQSTYMPGYKRIWCHSTVRQILPLVVNIFVTILTESTGLIHSTCLRWALGRKLNFNSNLRLFTRVPEQLGFGPFSNMLNALFLILSYTSTAAIFSTTPNREFCSQMWGSIAAEVYDCPNLDSSASSEPLFISLLACGILGIGLIGQAIMATLQIRRIRVPTWSSSPLDNAWASLSIRDRNPGRCLMSVHDLHKSTVPILPRDSQRSAWTAHPEVRRIFTFVWILIVIIAAWCVAVFGALRNILKSCIKSVEVSCLGKFWGKSWSLIPDTSGISTFLQITAVGDVFDESNLYKLYSQEFMAAFAIQVSLQARLTMCLHCIELLVTISRDEDSWRKACSDTGYRNSNAIVMAVKSWKSLVLLISKPIVHWLFGLSVEFYHNYGILMRPVQIFYMLVAMILVAVFTTFLCFKKPKGPQPATFGHIQTLIDLIDIWSEPLHWGGKDFGAFGTREAGTVVSKQPGKIIMDQVYGGWSENGVSVRPKLAQRNGENVCWPELVQDRIIIRPR